MRTLRSGVSRGTETLVFRGGVPPDQHERDAGAAPGGRLPRAGEVRLPQRRRRRGRARRRCSAAPSSACTRTRRRTSCRPPTSPWCPTASRRPGGAGRHRRDRGQRALGRGADGRRPGRRGRSRDGRLLRGAAAGRDARRRGHARRRRPDPGRGGRAPWASRSPTHPRRRAAATSSCTPAPPRPGCAARWSCSAPEGEVVDLSWYGDTPVRADLGGAFHSGRLRLRASQVGEVAPAARGTGVPAASGWRWRSTCCATRRSTRCSPAPRRSTELPELMADLSDGRRPRSATP